MLYISHSKAGRPGCAPGQRRYTPGRNALFVAGLLIASSAWAQTAPQLSSVTPPDGATDIAVTSGFVFEFDQPMDTSVILAPSFPPFFVGNFEVSAGAESPIFDSLWSNDGRTLTAQLFVGELPTGTLIEWTLNPAGGAELLVSEGGGPLATVSGSFTTEGQSTGGDADCDGVPDTWGFYGIFKGANYEQASTADPLPAADYPYTFGALVGSPEAGAPLSAGSLRFPDGSSQDLDSGFGTLSFLSSPPSESLLDSLFPAGSYTLRFTQTGEPDRVIPMAMPANSVPVPKLANFDEAQTISAAQDFVLLWNQFDAAGPDDQISLTVESDFSANIIFQAPDLCVPSELPATATSVVIPANTLLPDQIYTATLTFSTAFYLSTDAVPEMSGSGTVARATTFTLDTSTGGTGQAVPATLSSVLPISSGNPRFDVSGSVGHTYSIERTATLINPSWLNVGTVTMDGAGQGVFVDTTAGQVFPLFYRAVTN